MQQIISSSTMRMTSVEIADMVEKRHDNVKRTIETLVEQSVIQLPQIEEVENNQSLSPNSRSKAYVFEGEKGKRDSIIVVAQLSPQFTARLVDRWQELESQQVAQKQQTLPVNEKQAIFLLTISRFFQKSEGFRLKREMECCR